MSLKNEKIHVASIRKESESTNGSNSWFLPLVTCHFSAEGEA